MDTQEEINDGQRKINGALCYVDWHIIKTLKALTDALNRNSVLPPEDIQKIHEALTELYSTSKRVAEIKPPGCNPNFFAQDVEAVRAA